MIASVVGRYNLRPGATSASISDRLSLYASFIQGIEFVETAITEGLYVQAATLLKQQMETVAAMNELAKGTRQDGRTPNVKHLLWQMNRHYDSINDAAHVGKRDLLRGFYQADAQGDAVPASVMPRFSATAARYLYTLEVGLLVGFVVAVGDLLQEMYGESWTDEERRFLFRAVDVLEREGAFDSISSPTAQRGARP
jgi:hypothetical protein